MIRLRVARVMTVCAGAVARVGAVPPTADLLPPEQLTLATVLSPTTMAATRSEEATRSAGGVGGELDFAFEDQFEELPFAARTPEFEFGVARRVDVEQDQVGTDAGVHAGDQLFAASV